MCRVNVLAVVFFAMGAALFAVPAVYAGLPSDILEPSSAQSQATLRKFFEKLKVGNWNGKIQVNETQPDGTLSARSAQGALGVAESIGNGYTLGEGFCTIGESQNLCWDALSGYKINPNGLQLGFGDQWTRAQILESTPCILSYLIKTNEGGVKTSTEVTWQIVESPQLRLIRHELFKTNGIITGSRLFVGRKAQ